MRCNLDGGNLEEPCRLLLIPILKIVIITIVIIIFIIVIITI